MKIRQIKQQGDMLEITTEVYQATNGGLFLNWGNTSIKLEKEYAENIAYDIPNFDVDLFNEYYSQ
jgi:hypothetical protein